MTRLDAPTRDLGEEVVERVVAARDDQNTLLGEAAVEVADDLHDHVGLAGARRPHHQRQSRAHSAADGLHLRGREAERVFHDGVGERGQFGRSVGVCVGRSICGDDNLLRFLLAFLIVRRESDTERRLRRRLRQFLAALRPERHHILRKRLHHMSRIHKSVGEVDRRSLRRHSRVLRSSRVSESQQHSLQPSRHRSLSLGGHLQLSRRRQHGLEGVAGGVASHQQVEGGVGVFDLPFRHARHVPLVLRRVQSHLQPPLLPRTLLADVRRRRVVERNALFILHADHLAPADDENSLLLQEINTVDVADGNRDFFPQLLSEGILVFVAISGDHMDEEENGMFSNTLPALSPFSLQPPNTKHHLSRHLPRDRLSHAGTSHGGERKAG